MQTRDSRPVLTSRFRSSLLTKCLLFVVSIFGFCQVSSGALIAYWNFDESAGTNVFDTAGNTVTHNGFFAAGAETPARVAGRLGGAVGFTWQAANTPGSGRRVIVPHHTNLLLNSPFTISYWYRMDAPTPAGTFPGIMRIGSQSAVPPAANVGWGFFRTANMVHKRGNVQPAVSPALAVGQWSQLVLSYNGSNRTVAYFNGNPFVTNTTSWSTNNSTAAFEMGRMDAFDQATLDELALWNEAVDPAKIRSIYTVPVGLNVDYNLADLRALWGVFDGTGSSNAVVKGAPWTYAASVPGSVTPGDAYVSGGAMYLVLGPGTGVVAPIVAVSGLFSPGGIGIIGSLSPTNTFTLTNANLLLDLTADTTPGLGSNDLIDAAGDLVIANTRVSINPLAPLTAGNYRLINYGGAKTGSLTLSNTTRYTLALDESTTNQINVAVSGTNGALLWTSASSSAWDLSTINWSNLLTAAPDRFYQGDSVLFDDSGAFQTNITVTTPVFPRSITVNSSTRPYIFTGTEQIGGMAEGIIKNGTSALVLSTPNTFSGDVQVNAGTLRLGNASGLGNTNGQTLIAAGATLDLGGISPGLESVTVQGAGVGNLGAVVNTGASLVNNGLRGRVTLLGDTTFGASARWDILGAQVTGNGFKVTKVGGTEMYLNANGDMGFGDVDVQAGFFTWGGNSTPGDPTKTYTVASNSLLNFFAHTVPFNKNLVLQNGAAVQNGSGSATLAGPVTLNGTATFNLANAVTVSNVISGPGLIVKTGAGTLSLSGINTYGGLTSIRGGRLTLLESASIATSPRVEVLSGTTFDVSRFLAGYPLGATQTLAGVGTVAGSLVVPTGARILPGAENVAGTLSVTNGLSLAGGALVFDITGATNEGANINDLINVGGNLDLTGVSSIGVNPLGLLTVGNTYTLINYSGTLTGTEANLTIVNNSRYTFALSLATPGKVLLTVTGGAAAELFWFGGTMGAETLWDIQTTPNWSDLGGNPQTFFGGDQVVFDDFATTNVVDLVGTLTPASIRIENGDPAFDYTFQGSGKLSGNSSLTKLFTSKVTIANTAVNDYVGPTDIRQGTLQVGSGGTVGNLGSGPITNSATLILNRSDTLTLPNSLLGNGNIVKSNANLLLLPNANPGYSGSFTVAGGTIRPGVSNALGNTAGGTVVNPGATLDVNAINLFDEPVAASGPGVGGAGAIINGSATGQNNALRFVTLNGDTVVGGTGRWDVRAAPTAALSTGGNGYSLTKVGANQVSIVDAAVDPALGDININSGTLSFEVGSGAGNPTNTVNVASNATLQFFNMAIPWNKVAVFNGGQNVLNSSGNTVLSGPVTLNAPVTFNVGGASLTVLGPIGGSGALTKATGQGSLILGADNTYAGNTTNAAGQLYLGVGGSAGSVLGSIVNNGTLAIYRDDLFTLTNPYSGSGSISIRTANGTIFGNTNMNVPGSVLVGHTNVGRLIIPAGFTGTWGSLFLGESPNVAGEVLQLGGAVTVTSQLRVGHWPNNSSVLTMGGGSLTLSATPAGVVNQTGASEQAGIIYLGVDGTGTLLQTGGVIRAHGMVMDSRAVSPGTDAFILNGGQLILGPSGIKSGSLDANPPTTYAINLGGGTLGSSANWTSTLAMTLTGTNGDVTLDTGSFSNTLNGAISGSGGLVKAGTGTLRLNGTNTFAGTLTVSNGALGGNGSLSGPVVVQAGGTLSPGLAIGALQINNSLGLAGNTLIEVNKTGFVLTNDRVLNVTALTYGGTLTIVASGSPLASGDTFAIFGAATYGGSFTTINLPALPGGLTWNLNNLPVNGSISVVAAGPRIFTPTRSGNTLTLAGTGGAPGAAFRVLRSADIAASLATWAEASTGTFDSSGNFSVDLTINPADPQLFYVIVSP